MTKKLPVRLQVLWVFPLIVFWMTEFWSPAASYSQAPAAAENQAFRLQNARPVDLAPQLREMLNQYGAKSEVFIDRSKNGVVVYGSGATRQLAAQLIETLDKRAASPVVQTAGELAGTAKGYHIVPDQMDAISAELNRRFPASLGVRIAPDRRTSQLVIIAPPAVHAQIGAYLQTRPGAVQRAVVTEPRRMPVTGRGVTSSRTYRFRNISWRQFEDSLKQMWGDSLHITAGPDGQSALIRKSDDPSGEPVMRVDRLANEVQFTGLPDADRSWRQIAAALDRTRDRSGVMTSLVPLRRAAAADVQQAVSMIRDAALRTDAGDTMATRPVSPPGTPNRASNLVSMIFQPAAQAAANGQAPAKAPAAAPATAPADATPEAGPEEDVGLLGDVQIEFIPELGVVILRGNRRDVERVQGIIDEIEEQSKETRPEIQVVPLLHSNSEAMSELIIQIYADVYESRQGSLSITALVKPNAILLVGRKENIATVLELITELDKPVSPDAQIQVFRLLHMAATDAQQYIENIYGTTGQTTGGAQSQQQPRGLSTRVTVIADFRSNSLVVQASPRDLLEVTELLRQLDVDKIEATVELRVFPLKNAVASVLQTVLEETLTAGSQTGATQGGAGAPQQNAASKSVQIIGIDQEGNKIIESGLLTDLTVSADDNANALIVKAPKQSMGLVEALIQQLDKIPEAESQIKVFQIRSGDATNLTAMLQELFGQQVTAGSVGVFSRTVGSAFGGQNQLQQTSAGESSLIPLNFGVDARTNSIVASGSKADLAIVEAILLRLDEGDLRQRDMTVYRLNNAPAQFVADALDQILADQQTLLQQQQSQQFSLISQFEFIDQQVFIVPEVISNTLIVSATPKYYEQITKVIEDLDRRPPMIMIQVVVALVRLDDNEELGVEMGIQDSLLFDRSTTATGLLSPGFDFVNRSLGNADTPASLATSGLLAGQAFNAFNMGRTSASEGFPGLVLSASNESLSVLIRALAQKSRVQVISRPQIMTMNNVPASVQIGQRVPQITDFQTTTTGTVNSVELIETGISLGVIPRVTPDGLIIMDVEAGDSQVGDVADGIPIGVQDGVAINSPIFDDITAITTIAARSGQTVVFGGLISQDRSDTFRGVPYLSQIPVLGHLFRFDTESKARKELIFFLTPHIVMDDRDLDLMNQTEAERMSWCLADVIQVHGDPGFGDGGTDIWHGGTPVIFPDDDPTAQGVMMQESTEIVPTPREQQRFVPGDQRPNDKPFILPPDQRKEGQPFILPPEQRKEGKPFLNVPNQSQYRPNGPTDFPTIQPPQTTTWQPPATANPWQMQPPANPPVDSQQTRQAIRPGMPPPTSTFYQGPPVPNGSYIQR